jgi:hypothetical protein
LRDGTIGIPSQGAATSLQALLSNQVSSKGTDTDALAKLGGLQLSERVDLEILAESFQASVPRTILDGTPPLPKMSATSLSDLGFRFRIRLSKPTVMAVPQKCLELHREAKQARIAFLQAPPPVAPGEDLLDTQQPPNPTKNRADADAKAAALSRNCDSITVDDPRSDTELSTQLLTSRAAGWTLSTGARFIRRSSLEDDGEDSQGLALEAAMQYISSGGPLGHSGFLSGSTIQLSRANDKLGALPAIFPRFGEWRSAIGYELRSSTTLADVTAAPRIGAYAAVSRANWSNEFATGVVAHHVTAYRYEAAFYVSGHFFGGFNGLVSFGVVVPYGHDETPLYIISLTPAIGTALGSRSSDKKGNP